VLNHSVTPEVGESLRQERSNELLVLLADEHRFELPAGFSIRVRQMLAKEFEKAQS
jgi:hypothetical protein